MQIEENAREVLISIADDFQNNFLSRRCFAERNGLTEQEAWELLELAQKVRSHTHPEA